MDISEKAFISPDFKACKMKSKEAVNKLLGLSLESERNTCADINRTILDRVMYYISSDQKDEIFRFWL